MARDFSDFLLQVRPFIRLLASVLAVLAIALFSVGCAKAPGLVGSDNPELPADQVAGATKQVIFIATTRQASGAEGVLYSGKRSEELGLASVTVSIPPTHKPGQIERARTLPPDPSRHFAIVNPTIYATEDVFVRALDEQLLKLAPENQNVLFFVHGYNTTLSDAILRLAQFVEDTEFDGVPVLLSWASAAKTLQYVYDINSALAARSDFLRAGEIVTRSRARQFDILAFSMGGFLTMEAIAQAEIAGEFNPRERVRNIILAAPDIDMDVFRSQLEEITHDNQKIFVLVSSDDSALSFSKLISGGVDRVGAADATELAEYGVTVIDLSRVSDSNSGSHAKFAASPEVVRLIGDGIRNSSRPGRSPRDLRELVGEAPIEVVSN